MKKQLIVLLAGLSAASVHGQICQPGWQADLGAANMDGGVEALRVLSTGAAPALYVGGGFTSGAGLTFDRIARFDGSWSAVGDGIAAWTHGTFGCCAKVHSLAVFDGGAGPALHVGGDFMFAGTTQQLSTESITRWQGGQWHDLQGGFSFLTGCVDCPPRVYALEAFDAGAGPRLVAAGSFDIAGGAMMNNIAQWDGSAWSTMAFGVQNFRHGVFESAWISALAVYNGSLYASGHFNEAAGAPANAIVRWTGSTWATLGDGLEPNGDDPPFSYGNAMAVFDDGSGPALFVGGEFNRAGGVSVLNIARWDGANWHDVGGGVNAQIRTMAVFNDGSGPALYVGGDFTEAGGQPASRIARWNGSAWSALGAGLDSAPYAMAAYTIGGEPTLVVGGWFSSAGGQFSPYLARWVGCATCYPDCNADGQLNLADFGCFQTKFALQNGYADCNGDGILNLADFGCFQTKFALGCP